MEFNFEFLLALLPTLFIVWAIFSRRRSIRRGLAQMAQAPQEEVHGSREDFERADAALQQNGHDLRTQLLQTHVLQGRYGTRQGFSREYMANLTQTLGERGISSEAVFQETNPMGSVGAILEQTGIFELYVEREKLDQANEVIASFRKA